MKKRQQVIATKVGDEAWLRLNDIAKRMGLTPYRLLQETVDTLILYMDESRQLGPDMQMVIDCFERFEGWGSLARLTDISVRWQVADAVYFCRDDRTDGMAGTVGCWRKGSMMGKEDYTFNKVDILQMTIRRLFPDLYRELQMLGMQTGGNNCLETIKHCVHHMLEDPDKATIRELFADCGRTEYGRPAELTKYVRHNRKNIETAGEPRKRKVPQQLDMFDGAEREDTITTTTHKNNDNYGEN